MNKTTFIGALVVAMSLAAGAYLVGYDDGANGRDATLVPLATAAPGPDAPSVWSATAPYPHHDVYYPGTEQLQPDEMRVIACGTGMPLPRLKQAAACFLVELGACAHCT